MTMTVIAPAEQPTGVGGDDELNHLYCCDPNIAHCGADISDANEIDFGYDDPGVCIVCLDLDAQPCSRCGWSPDGWAA